MTSSKRSLLAIVRTKLTKRGSSTWIWVATALLWYFSLWQLPDKEGRDNTPHPPQEMVLFLIITLQVTPGLWLPLLGQLESLKLRNTGLSHSQLVKTSHSQKITYKVLMITSGWAAAPGVWIAALCISQTPRSQRKLRKQGNCWREGENNQSCSVVDVVINQVFLAGEICFKRGKRDTGRDNEEKHTKKTC